MSPEQVRGEELDPRTDLFSLGAVLYEMATGQQAFSGNTPGVIFHAILERAPIPPRSLNPGLPAKLEEIINTALEKDRELRCQTAAELRAYLKRLKREVDSSRSVPARSGGSLVSESQAKPAPATALAAHPLRWAVVASVLALLAGHEQVPRVVRLDPKPMQGWKGVLHGLVHRSCTSIVIKASR
jgi:serine/threonine protein kinase